jgi:hypothetical protein
MNNIALADMGWLLLIYLKLGDKTPDVGCFQNRVACLQDWVVLRLDSLDVEKAGTSFTDSFLGYQVFFFFA